MMVEQKPAARTRGTGRPIRLLLVDDRPEVLAALCRWFTYSKDFDCVAALPGPDRIEDALVKLEPHVALVDWDMPGVDTYELLNRLVRSYPGTFFAVLSGYTDPPTIRAAVRAGALGYLSKHGSPAALAAEVRMLAEGWQVFSDDVKTALLSAEPENS